MNFVRKCEADVSADLVYRMCPIHLLEPAELLKDLQAGQVLEVLTDYDGALEDIPSWCAQNGQEFIGINADEGEYYRLYIRKLH